MRLALDIDNTLCDSMPAILRRLNAKHGTRLAVPSITSWDFTIRGKDGDADLGAEIVQLLNDDAFVASQPAMPYAKDLVKWASAYFEVVLMTARPWEAAVSTFHWVRRNFGAVPVVHTVDKGNHGVHILVDDAPKNIDAFLDAPGEGKHAIIFHQPWNASYSREGVVRCHYLKQVRETLETILKSSADNKV